MEFRKLWIALGLVMILSFAVLGGLGYRAINNAPPIHTQVLSSDGSVLFDGNAIQTGQNVWQSIGGQEVGTVWGHGAYVAPDWTADYLHRDGLCSASLPVTPMPNMDTSAKENGRSRRSWWESDEPSMRAPRREA